MPRPFLTIDSFDQGMIQDDSQATTSGASLFSGIDIFSEPGVAKPSVRIDNEINTIDDEVTDFEYFSADAFPSANDVWAVTEDELLKRIVGIWRLVHTLPANGVGVNSIKEFASDMYYSSKNNLGKTVVTAIGSSITDVVTTIPLTSSAGLPTSGDILVDDEVISYTGISGVNLTGATRGINGTTAAAHSGGAAVIGFDDVFQAYTSQDFGFHPLEVHQGSLYIGDGRHVAKLESTGTFFPTALVLSDEVRVRSLASTVNNLAVGTLVQPSGVPAPLKGAEVFFWSGIETESFSFVLDAATNGVRAMKVVNNELFVIAGDELALHAYNGANFTKIFEFTSYLKYNAADQTSGNVFPNAMEEYNGGLLIGLSVPVNSRNGVYEFNKNQRGQWVLVRRFLPTTNNPPNESVTAVFGTRPSDIFVGSSGVGGKVIDKTNSSGRVYGFTGTITPFILTPIYEISDFQGFSSLVQAIRLRKRFMNNVTFVTIKFTIDQAGGEQTLGTLDEDNIDDKLYGIYKRANFIQFKIEFTQTVESDINIPKITTIELY